VIPRPLHSSVSTAAEAGAWVDVLVRRRLVHAAVLTPTGQWLLQDHPGGPVRVLAGSADVLALAATIQHHARSARPDFR
jgi:hypothetical protein